MKQLALATSTRTASLCLWQGDRLVLEAVTNRRQRVSAQLIATIQQLLREAKWQPHQLQVISISLGPGSFTGLRLGITTAKTLAYALDCLLIPVSTHLILAHQAVAAADRDLLKTQPEAESVSRIATVIDAQRGQWFAQQHERHTDGLILSLDESSVLDPQTCLDSLKEPTLLCGPGLGRQPQRWILPPTARMVSQQAWQPMARTIGRMVAEQPDRFPPADPFQLLPVYGRPSAAEEKLTDD